MGLSNIIWKQKRILINSTGEDTAANNTTTFKEVFQILTITLLSLLLPLSFLILARLTTAHYLFFTFNSTTTYSHLLSLFLYTYPTFLHPIIAFISAAALIHSLTGRVTLSSACEEDKENDDEHLVFRPGLYMSWIILCTMQVCVGLGIEGSIGAGVVGASAVGYERSLLSKTLFFFGLHQTMMYWSRTVVKPVVDDTVFGRVREESWIERVAMAAAFGVLWWWRLRDEVESLVVVAEIRRDVSVVSSMGGTVADFIGWWLYYLIVTIGIVRVVKGVMWMMMLLVYKQRRVEGIKGGVYCEEEV